MASENAPETPAGEKWTEALPTTIPDSTFAPAFLALGITFLLFGLVSSYVFSAAGALLMVWSIGKWISELLHGEPPTQPD